eukprot:681094-Pyramimonas_sp.AAC.1
MRGCAWLVPKGRRRPGSWPKAPPLGTNDIGTKRMGLAVRAAAACVHLRQKAACPTAAAADLGQH